jgi:hypothetical protein
MDDSTYNAVLCRTKHRSAYSDVILVLFLHKYTRDHLSHTKLQIRLKIIVSLKM